MEIAPLGIDLQWRPGLPPGAPLRLSMEVKGEPVAVAQAVFRSGDGDLASPPSHKKSFNLQPAEPALSDFDAYARGFLEHRAAAIQANPDPMVKAYGAFFNDLDVNTNAALITHSGVPPGVAAVRSVVIYVMEQTLVGRVLARRRWELKHPGTPAQGLPASPVDD
ncbi:MAG TPA: hypothetical protein VF705_08040, partial [Longimicrobium sp.]